MSRIGGFFRRIARPILSVGAVGALALPGFGGAVSGALGGLNNALDRFAQRAPEVAAQTGSAVSGALGQIIDGYRVVGTSATGALGRVQASSGPGGAYRSDSPAVDIQRVAVAGGAAYLIHKYFFKGR
jgi:hypothetical protein